MGCCLRKYQMALRSVLTIPLDMSSGLNYSHEGWVSLRPHDGHTATSVFSDNKCWMIYLRLIPRYKQTACKVLPSPWGLPLCSAHSLSLSQCLPPESCNSKSTLLSNVPRFAEQETLFCFMVSKLHLLVFMIRFLLIHWGRGHLNCLNGRSWGLFNLNQLLYCVSLKIYNKFANYEGWNFNSGNYLFTTDTK